MGGQDRKSTFHRGLPTFLRAQAFGRLRSCLGRGPVARIPGLLPAPSPLAPSLLPPDMGCDRQPPLSEAQASSRRGNPSRARGGRYVGVLGPHSGKKFQHRRVSTETPHSGFSFHREASLRNQ